jgi:Pro-kumamolisin, activation domain/Subtilase family
MSIRLPRSLARTLLAVVIAAALAFPAAAWLAGPSTAGASDRGVVLPAIAGPLTPQALASEPPLPLHYTELGRGVPHAAEQGPVLRGEVSILVTFQFANGSGLAKLLAGLQDPKSPVFHHYLTAAEFDREFGLPAATYDAAVSYFLSMGATGLRTYADHVTVSFEVSPAAVQALFHTSLESYSLAGRSFYAPTSAPELPGPLAHLVAGVVGLSSYSALDNRALLSLPSVRGAGSSSRMAAVHPHSGYPTPVTIGSTQLEFGSDFQVAYDQLSLFAEKGYPTDAVVATILWSGSYQGPPMTTPWGNLSTGQAVGPFVPKDIHDYYNQTLPSNEPHATVTGVPVNGAPAPGPLSSYDSTTANYENTLDLEMVGSTAPGAQIYNVYGPTPSNVDLDASFAYILSPNSSFPGLAKVSVITNSWGGTDGFDAGWNSSSAMAAARGITVLAASGDSGSNPNGFGGGMDPPGQLTFFPASMAYNTYGVVAVGGTTVTLDPSTLQMTSDIVWNESTAYTAPGPAAGSTGGISQIFAAPDWQNTTSAHNVTLGAGRGVPDIAAVANNTLVTLSVNGVEFNATNASLGSAFVSLAGTSISSPLTAGVIAEADHVLRSFNNSGLGFLDPRLYALANTQYATLPVPGGNAVTGYYVTNALYNTSLPTLPFYDVTIGQNFQYPALVGYDLTTGWGSIDAYNYTMYFATYLPANLPGDLTSIRAAFNLTGLVVTSTSGYYNASIQQNFFVANALGAPIYWVQNVLYVHGVPGAWQMNFTGWVVFPFWGLYPTDTIYEFNFPLVGQTLNTPIDFTIQTSVENTTTYNGQSVLFSFGVSGAPPVSLPIPGGSYILGGLWNNYSWGGVPYSNNPFEAGGAGSLSPQFGLVGGPSGGLGTFQNPTGGDLQLSFQRFGSTVWVPGATKKYDGSIDQTGEGASGLLWTLVTPANQTSGKPANWSLGVSSGSTDQGVLEYDAASYVPTSLVTVSATGAPVGAPWSLSLSNGQNFTGSGGQLQFRVANGTYTWVLTPPANYSASPYRGQFDISGSAVQISATFTLVTYAVTLTALGFPLGYEWWANVSAVGNATVVPHSTTTTTIGLQLPNGTYNFAFGAQSNWTAQPGRAQIAVGGAAINYGVAFAPPPTYVVTFNETGLPTALNWTVNVSGLTGGLVSNTSTVTRPLVNGTYTFEAHASIGGYFPVRGTFGVDGGPLEVAVPFAPAVFGVVFQETGLPANSLWGFQVAGGPFQSSTAASIASNEPNGTYNYSVFSELPGWAATPASHGQFTVNGTGVVLSVVFRPVTYAVTFVLSGLPAGESWTVSVDSGSPNSSTSSSLTVALPNGTYTFAVAVPSGWTVTPTASTFTVAGQSGNVTLSVNPKSSSSGSGGLFGLGTWAYVLIALVVIAALVAVAFGLRRRRPPPAPPAPEAPPTEANAP